MALPEEINVGTAANNGTGDPLRTAFQKSNARDEYLENAKEDKLGNPATDGMVLSSTAAGVRSWVAQEASGGGVTQAYVDNADASTLASANTYTDTAVSGVVQSVTGTAVDNTDPLNPVINSTGGGASVEDQIVDGVVDKAPSQNAVFDALAGKVDDSQVLTDVPSGAVFTDTVYDDTILSQRVTDVENGKQDVITTDESLYLDPETNILRANVSNYSEAFIFSTSQSFTLAFEPTNFLGIYVQGVKLVASQYTFTAPTGLTINDTLDSGDIIEVQYEHFITQP